MAGRCVVHQFGHNKGVNAVFTVLINRTIVVVPLETALPQQITLSVDGGKARRYPYSFCSQVGCYARVGFTSEDIASFKLGNAATVTIVPALAPDQKVELVLSLTGFTAAYDNASIVEP